MDYTPNFHLPQWNLDDRILMDDFNQFAASLDTALSLNQQAAQNAQEAAEEAKTLAQNASVGRLLLTCGSYTGTGGSQTINTGYWPMAVLVIGEQDPNSSPRWFGHRDYCAFFVNGGDTPFSAVHLKDFVVREPGIAGYPNLNKTGHTYYYISLHT